MASLIKELSALPDVDLKKRVYVVFNGKPLHKKKNQIEQGEECMMMYCTGEEALDEGGVKRELLSQAFEKLACGEDGLFCKAI